MGLFLEQRLESPEKWKSHYSFGGALLVGLQWEGPAVLTLTLSATKSGSHPGLAGLSEVVRTALPPESLLSTVKITCGNVRAIRWVGRPAPLAELKEEIGAFGRLDLFVIEKQKIVEADIWPDVPGPFEGEKEGVELWHGALSSHDFALQWMCETAFLRESR